MLMGEYAHTIDAKGRIILPMDFRAELGEHFVLTKGLDNCLFIYGENEWAAFDQKLRQLPLSNPKARSFMRRFTGSGRTLECDKQGRFLVPANLRSYAMLKKDVILTGVSNRVEVWSKEEWDRYNDVESGSMEEIWADLGI